MPSAFVWLVTPILDACNIETMLAISSSLRLCSHTRSVKLQIQNDKLFVIKFLDNYPCHICTWLSEIHSPLLKKSWRSVVEVEASSLLWHNATESWDHMLNAVVVFLLIVKAFSYRIYNDIFKLLAAVPMYKVSYILPCI